MRVAQGPRSRQLDHAEWTLDTLSWSLQLTTLLVHKLTMHTLSTDLVHCVRNSIAEVEKVFLGPPLWF